MFQYSQKRVWLNSCVLLSLLTTISNNIRTELFYPDIITCHKTIRRQDAGAIVNIATVSKVVNWFSNHYKKNLTTNELNISTALRHAKIWKYIAVGFRWNEDMFWDITSDGRLDKIPQGKTTGWHALTMTWDWLDYILLDNYFGERKHNIYKVSESIMKELINKKVMRETAYIIK